MSGMTNPLNEPRLLIYSQDGLGLGHMRRTSVIAARFLKSCPRASVLTISDSPTGRFFAPTDGHDLLKLPSVRKVRPGEWRPVSLASPFADVLALRRDVIRSAATAFAPDILLVDHMPHGAMGELVPTLEAVEPMGTRIVLGLRDIIDAPATVRRRWKLEGALEAVDRYYHDVLVYGSREVFDLAEQYEWPPEVAARVRYCGYVCAPRARVAVDRLRRQLLQDRPEASLVVSMAGGGADAHRLFETLLRALPRIMSRRPCVLVLVTGPFFGEVSWSRLRQLAKGLPVQLIRTVPDSQPYLAAADLVVSMAGYNTTAEILASGTRSLLVPREGPSAEQQVRARLFAERGWVRWLPPATASVESLAVAVLDSLRTPAPTIHTVEPDLEGAPRVVDHLLTDAPPAAVPKPGKSEELVR